MDRATKNSNEKKIQNVKLRTQIGQLIINLLNKQFRAAETS